MRVSSVFPHAGADFDLKNLTARGETRPASGAGGESTSGAEGYDNHQAVLGNPMDPSSQATDFASYSVAHQPDY